MRQIHTASQVGLPEALVSRRLIAQAAVAASTKKADPAAADGAVKQARPGPQPSARPGNSNIQVATAALAAPEAIDLTGLREAVAAFTKGDMDNGFAHARRTRHPVARAAAEWAALRLQPRKAGYSRIVAFLDAHQEWPKQDWLRWRAEQSLFIDRPAHKYTARYLKNHSPVSAIGQLAKARHLLDLGRTKEASQTVSAAWREGNFNTWLERLLIKEFSKQLSAEDFAYRAAHLFYRERYSHSLRLAGLGGKDIYALAAARVAVARGGAPTKFGAKLSAEMRRDPSWKFAQALRLRRSGKIEAAGQMMVSVKSPASLMRDGKAWWEERRMIARRLLDSGQPKLAYTVAAGHGFLQSDRAQPNRKSIADAEFYAGWLALRFTNDASKALAHFTNALSSAKRPAARARAAYWLGRAIEKSPKPELADTYYAKAAINSSTYYGQLALARLKGTTDVPLRRATNVAQGPSRLLAVRVVEALTQVDADTLAQQLAFDIARDVKDEAQIAAAATILKRQKDASSTLIIGKLAAYRGIQLDDVAFPDFGIPKYIALSDSAEPSMVYAIARQESAFRAKAKSHAGAKGLMQMLIST
ncbi:MAG: transglycosylase SLT domain-containing protein, partial [Beijerinckiaceae bacterium]|nr:transglycosylase SLT domain-containing protein [Beijerinckiaceae bacterium]